MYEFVCIGEEGELTAKNVNGSIEFGTLYFDEEDVGKTYTYTIKETSKSTDVLFTDPTVYEVKVTIADKGDGTLDVQTEIFKDGVAAAGVIFDNKLTTMLTISKKVEGLQTGEAFNMLVRFYDAQGNELTEAFAYTGDVTGTIVSGGKIALKHGQSVTISGMPDGTKYTVEEEVSKAYSTTVNGDYATKAEGLLTGSNNRVDFVNTMETTTFSVTKIWEGADLGTIILTLYADGVVMEPQPEYIKIDNVYRYSKLPKYNADGELIVYAAKEKGIEGYIRIYDNVAPYEDVTKFVHNGGTIINAKIPQTGDEAPLALWIGMMGVSGALLLMLQRRKRAF